MILDTSAIVSILLDEDGSDGLIDIVNGAEDIRVGAPSIFEAAMVMTGRVGEGGRVLLAAFLRQNRVDTISFTEAHWPVSQSAFVRFGKGRHPAGLNFGDCLTYAIAYVAGEPLLCIGNDFTKTDLELVPYEV